MASAALVRKIGDILVERAIEGGDAMYSAWERASAGSHGITRTLEDVTFGRVDTKAFPGRPAESVTEQIGAFVSWELAQRERAYMLIARAFPEATEGFRARGRVRLLADPEIVHARLARRGELPEESTRDHAPTFAGEGDARKKPKKK